jgi:hypothetical protein
MFKINVSFVCFSVIELCLSFYFMQMILCASSDCRQYKHLLIESDLLLHQHDDQPMDIARSLAKYFSVKGNGSFIHGR